MKVWKVLVLLGCASTCFGQAPKSALIKVWDTKYLSGAESVSSANFRKNNPIVKFNTGRIGYVKTLANAPIDKSGDDVSDAISYSITHVGDGKTLESGFNFRCNNIVKSLSGKAESLATASNVVTQQITLSGPQSNYLLHVVGSFRASVVPKDADFTHDFTLYVGPYNSLQCYWISDGSGWLIVGVRTTANGRVKGVMERASTLLKKNYDFYRRLAPGRVVNLKTAINGGIPFSNNWGDRGLVQVVNSPGFKDEQISGYCRLVIQGAK